MRISGITRAQSALNFTSKTTLYTDFDATYFPFKREDISPKNAKKFSWMYLPFDIFQKNERRKGNEFDVVVTTGRSKNDYLHTQEMIINKGLNYHIPEGLISSNGANVFEIKNGEIKDITPDSCDIDLFPDVKRIIEETDDKISVIECKINGDEKTYGNYSSEFELEKLPLQKREKYASIARDGKTNLEIVFPKSVDDDLIAEKIEDFINENDYPFTVEHYKDSPFTKAVQYEKGEKTIEGANLILLKQKKTDGLTDKFYSIKEKLEAVIEADGGDIIVAAGDSFNDEKMLNPLNYLDLMGVDTENRTQDELLEDEAAISALKNMPFKAIICDNNPKLDSLKELADKLDEKGVHIIHRAPDTIKDYPKALSKILNR